ncbi:MAG: calcium/sodium antiporter [Lachnospiraceae bacterium]|nr:calcium/sodium antiporter [Lachnospiraceae bacterium]
MEVLLQMGLLVLGFVMLIKGADWFVDGVSGIAEKFGIPQLVIGLTIVAMGTSAPEAAVSITAAMKGNAGITIGNVVGSNIMNVLVILGITSVITAIAVQKSTIRIELPFMIGVSAVLLVCGMSGGMITRVEGVLLWGFFLVYLGYLFQAAKQGMAEQESEEEKQERMGKLLLTGLIGMVLIIVGSDVTVDAANRLAAIFGMSERLIGLTIVAFGTSLPELVTSVIAARKGKADIAVGNIVGSNIFNILFVVGTTALIVPVPFAMEFLVDGVVAILAGILLWVCVFRKMRLERFGGVVMLVGYLVYFGYLLVK